LQKLKMVVLTGKGSANRTQCQIYLSIVEVQPTLAEGKDKVFLVKYPHFIDII